MSTHLINSSDHSGSKTKSQQTIPTASKPNNISKANSSLEFTSYRAGQTFISGQESRTHLSAIPEDVRDHFYPSPAADYQPDKIPPDINLAIRHGTAHRVSPQKSVANSLEICESTGVPFSSEKLSLFCSLDELYHLGPVFPMYFLLIKQICYTMVFLCLITGAIIFKQLSESSFQPNLNMSIFIANILQSQLEMSILIFGSLTTIFINFFVFYKFRRDQKQTKLACKKGHTSPSNYTIMSSGLGTVFTEEEIKTFFSECILQDYSLNVKRVVKTYDLKQYIREVRELTTLFKQKHENSSKSFTQNIDNKIKTINQFFKRRKVFLSKFKIIKKNDICFITFDTRKEAKVVRRRFELSPTQRFLLSIFRPFSSELNEYFFNKKFIKIQKAPEPTEIIWENLADSNSGFLLRFASLVISFTIFTITAFNIYYVKAIQLPYSDWITGIIIFLTNQLFIAVVFWLAQHKNYKTITQKNISLTYRLTTFQLVNMILPVAALQFISSKTKLLPNIFDDIYSLILIIAITCFGLPLIFQFLNLTHLSRVFARLKIRIQGLNCTLTQEQANKKFENPELNISILYSNILKIFLFSVIGFPFCPLIILIGFLALFLAFWIHKFNLLKRSLLPSYMRSELSEAMFETLDFSLVLLSTGLLVLILSLTLSSNSPSYNTKVLFLSSIVGVVFTVIYFFLPNKRLSREYFPLKRNEPSWSSHLFYQQAAEFFHTDYHFCNPTIPRGFSLDYVRKRYHETLLHFDCIDILQECPEILPMFAYSKKFPSFYQIWKQNLTGLKNPYYLFPQNYGYGFSQSLSDEQSSLKVSLLQAEQTPSKKRGTPDAKKANNESCSLTSSKNHDTKELMSMIKDMSNILKEKMKSTPSPYEKKDRAAHRTPLSKRHNEDPAFQNESTIKGGDFLVDMESLTFGASPLAGNSLDHVNASSHENSDRTKYALLLQNKSNY